MNTKPKTAKVSSDNGNTSNGLLIGDIARYLFRLADLQRDELTGNPIVSDGLRCLARALKPHQTRTIEDLSVLMSNISSSSSSKRSLKKPQAPLPENLVGLECEEVDRILRDGKYLKSQLIELGTCRFGISRSKLSRLPKSEAIASIRAALDHERSLTAIGNQAQMAGQRRSI